jgi:hypothetical protein
MKYSAPAIVSTPSAGNGLGNSQRRPSISSAKGDGTPDHMNVNSDSAYTTNS